jgi:hypothetical protein
MKDLEFKDIVEAEALGRKFAETYATHDAEEAAVLCLIPDIYSERIRLYVSVKRGIKSVKNDNFNYFMLESTFDQALKYLAELNSIRPL